MIRFKVNNEYLVLSESFSARFELVNPMFEIEKAITSPYSLSFSIIDDAEGVNRRLLHYFDHIANRNDISSVECEVYLYQNHWMTGKIAYKYRNGSFQCNFIQVYDLLTDIDTSIRNIELDTFDYNYQGGAYDFYDDFKERSLDSYSGTKDYVHYVVYNPNAFNNEDDIVWNGSGTNVIEANYLKYYNYWFCHCSTSFSEFYSQLYQTMQYALSPAIYLKYFFSKLFNQYNFNLISTEFLDLDDIEKLTMFTNRIFLMQVEHTGSAFVATPFMPFNALVDLSEFIPDVTIRNFLLGIKKTFCLVYDFDLKRNDVTVIPVKAIIANFSSVDWTNKVVKSYQKEPNSTDGFLLKIDYSNDRLIAERIKQIHEKREEISVATYANLPPAIISGLGSVCLVEDENFYYVVALDSNGDEEWQFYSENYLDYVVGNRKDEINIRTDSLLSDVEQIDEVAEDFMYLLRKWNIPVMSENNDSNLFHLDDQEENIRLLFYRGMQVYVAYSGDSCELDDCYYPYATRTELAPDGSDLGTYSLNLNGNNGLYNQWWKPFLDLMSKTRKVTYNMKLDHNDLINFDFKQKISIQDPDTGGSVNYYVKKISVRISASSISPAEVELYTA